MSTATTTTFEVSDVKRATETAVRGFLQGGGGGIAHIVHAPELTPKSSKVKRLQVSPLPPEAPDSRPVEACSRYHGRLLGRVAYHPVVAAVHRAFMDHRPLCLSPDMIWLMIIQGVANHINAHAEELRPRLSATRVNSESKCGETISSKARLRILGRRSSTSSLGR